MKLSATGILSNSSHNSPYSKSSSKSLHISQAKLELCHCFTRNKNWELGGLFLQKMAAILLLALMVKPF